MIPRGQQQAEIWSTAIGHTFLWDIFDWVGPDVRWVEEVRWDFEYQDDFDLEKGFGWW
jgi:hypothetical protein